ncbi:MAG: acetylglutamate kinase [Actinomycetota bacterium]|nr:acetylglutamate kinase [Actinomycetota bacterium]
MLVEALPYIHELRGRTIVVKYGGSAIAGGDPAGTLASFATDVVLLRAVGVRPVVVHGGGPQIGELMGRLGKVPEFRDGLRVTDAETLEIARMVLVGKVNRELVTAINAHGHLAIGLSGEDAGLLTASPRHPELGFVGDVGSVDADLLRRLVAEDLVPVVATIGSDGQGQAYNINADTAAGALAAALGAHKLVYLTDVEGIRSERDDPSSLLSRLDPDGLDRLVVAGAVAGGMVPKAAACVQAVRAGVGAAHVIDGRSEHALLLELLSDEGVGTMVSLR